MKKKKETEKAKVSKKKERAEKQPPKQDVSKWQEFLRRHSTSKEKQD
ncbi:MAG: hypothetical protein JSS30_06780 [Verrucomicrobia bacterium]|nr:hypothetical protein [Verrucomicrobiota bacterium]